RERAEGICPTGAQSDLAYNHTVKFHRTLAALLSFLMPSFCMRSQPGNPMFSANSDFWRWTGCGNGRQAETKNGDELTELHKSSNSLQTPSPSGYTLGP